MVFWRGPEVLHGMISMACCDSWVCGAYGEDDWNATSYWLAAIELSSSAEPESLLAIALPAGDGRAVQQNFDGVTGWERGYDFALVAVDAWLRAGGGRRDGRWLVRTVYWACVSVELHQRAMSAVNVVAAYSTVPHAWPWKWLCWRKDSPTLPDIVASFAGGTGRVIVVLVVK